MTDEFTDAPDPYWEQDARNARDAWDQHLRHVEDEEQDRLTRDAGESGHEH